MTSFYLMKFRKWLNTPKADKQTKLAIVVLCLLMLFGVVGSVFAHDRDPAPTSPTPTTTTETNTSDSHAARNIAISTVVIGIGVCIYFQCWKSEAPPKESGPIVPPTANDSSTLYGVQVEAAK